MNRIKIRYTRDVEKITKIEQGDWIDLRCAETVELKRGDFAILPLGVAMKLPYGHEAHVVPRSSTFKNYGIIQTNGIGIIDNSYCGDDDEWGMPVYATRDVVINKNDRVCQFRIAKRQDLDKITEVQHLNYKNRGGFGSTGTK